MLEFRKHQKFYWKEIIKARHFYPHNYNKPLELLLYFPKWYRSQKRPVDVFSNPIPWLTFGATNFIRDYLQKDMRVFEYGSGGSSLFFAQRVKEGFSVEHEKAWVEKVRKALTQKRVDNWNIFLVEAYLPELLNWDPANPDCYSSNSYRFRTHSFMDYASVIDQYPDKYFDVILIDGRARPSCFKHAYPKVKENGILILDNSEREHYRVVRTNLSQASWQQKVFFGPGPGLKYFWETTVWQRIGSPE